MCGTCSACKVRSKYIAALGEAAHLKGRLKVEEGRTKRENYIYKVGVVYGNVIEAEKPIEFYF